MRVRIAVIVGVLLSQMVALEVLVPSIISAAGSGVVISQLQDAGKDKSTDEFIELHNMSAADVSLAGWQIQYRAASNGTDCTKGWTTKATVAAGETIAAGGHYLFSPTIYLPADTSFSAGLASLGAVRLLDTAKVTQDALAWGASSCGTGNPATPPAAGQSLERYAAPEGAHGDNAADFFIQSSPAAQSSTTTFTAPAAPASTDASPSGSESAVPLPASAATLELTELMVDPVSPKTDANDEFVEIHNAGTEAVDAKGYAIKTGTHTYVLPAGVIAPDGYAVFTSGDTTISLTNSGGVANLLDPAGAIIDTAGTWGAAVPGASWAFVDAAWVWTLSPTPGEANEYTPVPGAGSVEGDSDYAAVELSELLPDPASPLTDANNEFIEIYNPTDQPVNLTGYTIKVGHDLSSKYVIKNIIVPAGGYYAIMSSVSSVALANDGSSVALYSPGGTQLGATVTYGKATTGSSWAHLATGWGWTADSTPGAENVYTAVTSASTASAAAKAAKAKAAAKPKATKAAAKPKATKAPKAAKTSLKPLLAATTSTGGRWLLYILAGLTIAYIIYEFRYDIRNYYFKLRGYPVGSPAPVPVPAGRGSDRAPERPRRG